MSGEFLHCRWCSFRVRRLATRKGGVTDRRDAYLRMRDHVNMVHDRWSMKVHGLNARELEEEEEREEERQNWRK